MHSAAQAEHTVVGGLGLEALEGGLYGIVLLGKQVIGPVRQFVSAHPSALPYMCQLVSHRIFLLLHLCGGRIPQTELPVSGSVAVPVGQRLDPVQEPFALHDEGGERRGGHGGGSSTRTVVVSKEGRAAVNCRCSQW